MVTRLRAERPRNLVRFSAEARDFPSSKAPRPILESTLSSIQWVTGVTSRRVQRLKREADHLPHLVLRLEMSGTVPQNSQITLWRVQGTPHVHKVRGITILKSWIEINIYLYIVVSEFYVVLSIVCFVCKEIF